MIYESGYWKKDLLKRAGVLRKRMIQRRWVPASFPRIEQTVMLGFYSIRKLIEVQKLSNDVAGQRLALDAFPWLGTPVNRHNRLYFNKLYDLKAGSSKNCDLLFVCHQLVHSYIFALCGDENMRLEGIYVTSERERHKFLYFASIQTIVDLFEQVGSNYPNQIHSRYDPQKQDYVLFSQVVSNEE